MRRCLSIIIRNDGQLYMMFKFERNDGLIENKRTTTSDEDNESEIKIINSFYQTGNKPVAFCNEHYYYYY
ncbi:hypothetical protein DERF_002036 [Dermatophagoides farinae]|uniref:Uncharacterized protein n=1 Tax=Dermatophagoides farinae TaxID=6954 RepID=A0A922IFY2_DERFA|nr:hypothetical protein DERF_002036 [Dermatophagoides farinae]